MEPLDGEMREAEGVLNPASARGPDEELYLFPRMVGKGNFSRIGRARVLFDKHGKPLGVERLGVALEPDEAWERNPVTSGVEDPRITFIAGLSAYVMTYTAYRPLGPRITMAVSGNMMTWRRMERGTIGNEPRLKADTRPYPNKDTKQYRRPDTRANPEPAA